MSWFKITFSPEDINAGRARSIVQDFGDVYVASGGPRDAALFKRNDSMYIYYFSPGAARVAMQLIAGCSGVPCSAPVQSEVKLMAGDDRLEGISFADL